MQYKIFTSDEGYGHLVRQRAILDELTRLQTGLQATLQTQGYLEAAKRIFGGIQFVDKFNNITWAKTPDGTPDLQKIRKEYADYIKRSDGFIAEDTGVDGYEFVLSDFVYEAFEIGRRQSVPVFGVAHHTWDWFFSKLYPLPVRTVVLKRLFDQANNAEQLFFPPLTPPDILRAYAHKASEVPLIVRQRLEKISVDTKEEFKVLILDSGTRLLSGSLKQMLHHLAELPDIHFFLPDYFDIEADNITLIGRDKVLLDYMPEMDLVICRAGFNTISECIAHRTPLLLIGESLNPEMESNMFLMKQLGLASFVTVDKLVKNLEKTLHDFIEGEYKLVKRHMNEHEIGSDGARVIAEHILNRVKG